jgi:DNA repair protein RecO (recombination protein O)
MALVTLDAIVLQAFSYSETSKIARLLTASHGVQSVIAKGARRPRSRFGGILEPFTDGTATFYLRENRDLHNLSEFELVRPRQRLGRDLIRFGAASLLAELVLRTGSEAAAPEVFAHLRRALDELESAPVQRVEAVALAECWALVTALGFGPALDACVACGNELPADQSLFMDYAAGGIHCPLCQGGGGAGRALPVQAREHLRALCAGVPVELDGPGAHWQLLERFLGYHLVEAGSLRSLDFLAEAMRTTP